MGVEVGWCVGMLLLKVYEILGCLEVCGVVFVNCFELVCYVVVLYWLLLEELCMCFNVDFEFVVDVFDWLLVW